MDKHEYEPLLTQDEEMMTVINDDNSTSDDVDYTFKDGNLVEYRIVHLPQMKTLTTTTMSQNSLLADNNSGRNLTQQYFVISAIDDESAAAGNIDVIGCNSSVVAASVQHDSNIYVNSPTRIAPQPVQITGNVIVKHENGIGLTNNAKTITTRSTTVPTKLTSAIDTKPKMKKRDDRRRANHNEIERRRRDKINHLIMKLGSIIPIDGLPGGEPDRPNIANSEGHSKGLILSKACEYIESLNDKVNSLNECLQKEKPTGGQNLTSLIELRHLREANKRLRTENSLLKAKITELTTVKPTVISLIDDDIDDYQNS